MSRAVLLILLAVAAAVSLWIVLGGERYPAGLGETATEPPPISSEPDLEPAGAAHHRVRPQLEVADASGAPRSTRVYQTEDGHIVRDHRSNPAPPSDQPLAPPPREKLDPVARATLGRVRLGMRPGVERCAREHGADLPAETRLQVVLYVDIAQGEATASGLELQGDAGEAVESCVREALQGLRVDVPGASDRSGYPMTFPFDLGSLRK